MLQPSCVINIVFFGRHATASLGGSGDGDGDDVSTAFDTNGRPLLYAACLGLCLSDRRQHNSSNKNDTNESIDETAAAAAATATTATTTATPTTKQQSTPLEIFMSILQYLITELDCPPNQPTFAVGCNHRPPIHLLARSCYVPAVSALLASGADPTIADGEGWTALMATCMASGGGNDDDEEEEEAGPTMVERLETAKLLLDYHISGDDSDDSNDDDDDDDDDDNDGYVVLNHRTKNSRNGMKRRESTSTIVNSQQSSRICLLCLMQLIRSTSMPSSSKSLDIDIDL